ncbi:hypothetical protein GGF46_001222, partial [Coemansia sp. RSA 552]
MSDAREKGDAVEHIDSEDDPGQRLYSSYSGDTRFAAYTQVVERSLQAFEYVSEWADVTAFLTKLERALRSNGQFAVVPHRQTVAKRLAQCLNPALPPGVHQKALRIYALVFERIGPAQLAHDLALYAAGLIPFLRAASLAARPPLVALVARWIAPLGPRLRPASRALAAGLLAAQDASDPNSADGAGQLVTRVRAGVGPAFFDQTLLLAVAAGGSGRDAALRHLADMASSKYPAFGDAALAARALAAALGDSQALVVRAALDVAAGGVPLRTRVLAPGDAALLAGAAASVVLRKDMALNRRLYAWLLGPAEAPADQAAHFDAHASAPLREALLGAFAAGAASERLRVLRVAAALTDRAPIARLVVQALVPLLRLLLRDDDPRLPPAARVAVEALPPAAAWGAVISHLIRPDRAPDPAALSLALFFVRAFDLDDDASLHVHLPAMLLAVLAAADTPAAPVAVRCCFARAAAELLARVPQAAFADQTASDHSGSDPGYTDSAALLAAIRSFYAAADVDDTDDDALSPPSLPVRGPPLLAAVLHLAKRAVSDLAAPVDRDQSPNRDEDDQIHSDEVAAIALEDACHVLRTATAYACDVLAIPALARGDDAWPALAAQRVLDTNAPFAAVDAALQLLLDYAERSLLPDRQAFTAQVPKFADRLWAELDPARPAAHTRATFLLCRLRALDSDACAAVEQRLASKLVDPGNVSELPRYGVFWHCLPDCPPHDALAFSRLLCLTLEGAADDACLEFRTASRAWIAASADANAWQSAVEALLIVLAPVPTHIVTEELATDHAPEHRQYDGQFDYHGACYNMGLLQSYIELASIGAPMAATRVTAQTILDSCEDSNPTWLQAVLLAAADLALTVDDDSNVGVTMVRARAARLVTFLINHQPCPEPLAARLQVRFADALLLCIVHGQSAMQPPLLEVLGALVVTHASSLGHAASFSRLILAAFTLQLDPAALGPWVQFVRLCEPYIRGSLVRSLVLPCLDALRLLLAHCAFRLTCVPSSEPSSAATLLHRRLSPQFAVPPHAYDSPVSVDVLAVLLDALDLFLGLCLRNAGHSSPTVAGEPSAVRLVSTATPDMDSGNQFSLVPILAVLRDLWEAFEPQPQPVDPDPSSDSQLLREFGVSLYEDGGDVPAYVKRRVHGRISAVLERASAVQPSEVAEAAVVLWTSDNPMWRTHLSAHGPHVHRRRSSNASTTSSVLIHTPPAPVPDSLPADNADVEPEWDWRAADLLEHVPGRSPAAIVGLLLDDLHMRALGPESAPGIDDVALLRFVELYTRHHLSTRAAAPLALRLVSLLREFTGSGAQSKPTLPFMLRTFTELCERVARAAPDDYAQHDLAPLYAQLVDNCIAATGRQAPDEVVDHILTCLASLVIPQLPLLMPDYDRQVSAATNLVNSAVTPALRSHMTGGFSGPPGQASSRSEHFALVLRCLVELAEHASLMRVWRREVWDFFNDTKFFPVVTEAHPNMTPALAPVWRRLVGLLLASEKDRFGELQARVTVSSAPALFTN